MRIRRERTVASIVDEAIRKHGADHFILESDIFMDYPSFTGNKLVYGELNK